MPSLFAASSTVLPCGTCTARPSTSMLSNLGNDPPTLAAVAAALPPAGAEFAPWGGAAVLMSDIRRHEALLVRDVVLELAAEMLDEALHRQRGSVAERADRAPLDVVGDVRQHVEVLGPAVAVLDAIDHAPHPAGALAAGRALAARFLEVEVRQPQQALHHATRLVEHDDGARAEHRAGLGDRVVIHREPHHHVARQHRRRRAAGNDAL